MTSYHTIGAERRHTSFLRTLTTAIIATTGALSCLVGMAGPQGPVYGFVCLVPAVVMGLMLHLMLMPLPSVTFANEEELRTMRWQCALGAMFTFVLSAVFVAATLAGGK